MEAEAEVGRRACACAGGSAGAEHLLAVKVEAVADGVRAAAAGSVSSSASMRRSSSSAWMSMRTLERISELAGE